MYVAVFVTVPSKKEAQIIAQSLIKDKLAACVNIVGNISSLFYWKGKIDKARELLLIIKSKKSKLGKISKCVKSLHSYEIPEIIALPIISGEKKYLGWLDESLKQ